MGQDAGVVEGQRWQIVQIEPADLGSVAARSGGLGCHVAFKQRQVGDANRPAARVAPGIAEGVELLHVACFDTRLFL
jgi:hypothetical protein